MTLNVRAAMTRAAAALWLAVTLVLTLTSVGQPTPVPFWSFFAETMAGVDYAQNVVLFLPLGWIACRGHWGFGRVLLAGALVSGGIELVQQWVPGRTSQASDIMCNTAGAALGWWLAAGVGSTGATGGQMLTRLTLVARLKRLARLEIAFIALAGLMTLHVLNTLWPSPPTRGDAGGAWTSMYRVSCPAPSRASTICLDVPNTAQGGTKYARIVGDSERTYARVQSNAVNRALTRRDCVLLSFESTIGATLKLRPPLRAVCALADSTDSTFALRVDPRLEHEVSGEWTPTRASEWMWPVWPFTAYRPTVLRVAGALTFIVVAALMAGAAPWGIPAGYLIMLELVALVVGMRGPGWLEVGWAAIAWVAAVGAVTVDRWWRGAELTT
ncbi:MAG: VanZ family protein [Gemmatimonadaceae bacterium]